MLNSTNHALSWFIVQINGLREQIPTANFSDVEFLRQANALMSEITQIDADVYLLPYENVDRYAIDQILERAKKETLKIRRLIRRAALEITAQPKDLNLLNHISISLQSLSISLSQLNKELKLDYYLPLFSYSSSDDKETQ